MGACCSEQSQENEPNGFRGTKSTKVGTNLNPVNSENKVQLKPPGQDSPHAPVPYIESSYPNLPNLPSEALKSDSLFPLFKPLPPRRESFISYPNFSILNYQNGIYKGQFKKGKPHGFGISFDSKQNGYQGWWENGDKRGHGRYVFANGEIYDGMVEEPSSGNGNPKYSNGVRQGWGIHMDNKRDIIYSGGWENDKKHGKGRFDMPQGIPDSSNNIVIAFEGEFKNDLTNGEGQQFHKDGSQIKGTWKDGNLDGVATWTSQDLTDFKQGTWSNGKFLKWN